MKRSVELRPENYLWRSPQGVDLAEIARSANGERAMLALMAAAGSISFLIMGWTSGEWLFPFFLVGLATAAMVAVIGAYAGFRLEIKGAPPEIHVGGIRLVNPRFIAFRGVLDIPWSDIEEIRTNIETRGERQTLARRLFVGRRITIVRRLARPVQLFADLDKEGRSGRTDEMVEAMITAWKERRSTTPNPS